MIKMVPVNKKEKEAILAAFPNANIVRTMKQDSKRGHYYCVEDRNIMRFLNEFRYSNVIEEHPPRKKNFQKNQKNNYQRRWND